jgi:hypothetical protein
VQGELRTREYTDEKKVASQIVAQNIFPIDYTKLRARVPDALEQVTGSLSPNSF